MIAKELYESITLAAPCHQAEFLNNFDLTVRALLARYGPRYVLLPGAVYDKALGIEDEIPVLEFYYPAIRDNILYLLTGNGDRKTDYVAEADDAYKTAWRQIMRGRKFRDAGYKYTW